MRSRLRELRQCKCCDVEKPLFEFDPATANKYSCRRRICRTCLSELTAGKRLRRCNHCKVEKPLSEFDKRAGDRSHNYKAWCRDCHRTYGTWFMNAVYKRDPVAWMEKQRARHAANPTDWLFQSAKRRARLSGLEFSITKADIAVPARCPLLGIELKVGRGKPSEASPTLDRIDNALGYVPGNVWVISYKANTLKSNATLDELERLVRNLRAYLEMIALKSAA